MEEGYIELPRRSSNLCDRLAWISNSFLFGLAFSGVLLVGCESGRQSRGAWQVEHVRQKAYAYSGSTRDGKVSVKASLSADRKTLHVEVANGGLHLILLNGNPLLVDATIPRAGGKVYITQTAASMEMPPADILDLVPLAYKASLTFHLDIVRHLSINEAELVSVTVHRVNTSGLRPEDLKLIKRKHIAILSEEIVALMHGVGS